MVAGNLPAINTMHKKIFALD